MTFKNTHLFAQEAAHFKEHMKYTFHQEGSVRWLEYWDEQLRRCSEGFEVDGVRITGPHYGYLNFAQIKLTEILNAKEPVKKQRLGKGSKIVTFPDFWDGDYHYFHALEKARDEGFHMIVAKARRKGFSYKNAWVVANRYNTERNSISLIGAFEKKYLYPEGTMAMASNYLNFINENTGWAKRRQLLDKVDHKKASYVEYLNGIPIEKGYKSQIIAVTFKDNPDAARGKDATLILFEEAGKFPNLKASYLATKPSVEDGKYVTGQILIFGTGGDMESGTIDFEDMFYDPKTYNLMPFENIWDENPQGEKLCGFFFPDFQNKPGFIDKNGNSLIKDAKAFEEAQRENKQRTSKDKKVIDKHITEYPFTPKEAFLQIKGNIFPAGDLLRRLAYVESSPTFQKAEFNGDLSMDQDGTIKFIANPKLRPIKNYPLKGDEDTEGCITIFEMPQEDKYQKVPYGVYIAGIDPYDHDKAGTGSLGSTFIMNRLTNRIVAEYTARPSTAKEYYENVRRLLVFYNAKALYENERKGIFDYFENAHSSYLLADEPQLIRDIIRISTVQRKKGIHMTTQIKEYGESLILQWLLEENEDTNNLNKIRSVPLLKELISYNDEGNFDRAMALMCLLYYNQELHKYKPDTQSTWKPQSQRNFFSKLFKDPIYR